jgi:hypothetical protein
MFRTYLGCLVALASTGAFVIPAQAKFQQPVIISDSNTDEQRVAMNATGTAIVVWRHFNDGAQEYEIQGLIRSADGTYGSVQTLGKATAVTEEPDAAIDGAGNAYVTWVAYDGSNRRIYARPWPAGGSPGPVTALSASGWDADLPEIAVGTNGPAVAVWQRAYYNQQEGHYTRIQTRSIAADGTLGATEWLSHNGGLGTAVGAYDSHIAVAPNGAGVVAWNTQYPGYDNEVQGRLLSSKGKWGGLQQLTPEGDWNYYPQVAIDKNGDAIVVWDFYAGNHGCALPTGAVCAEGRFRPAGGGFADVQEFSGTLSDNIQALYPRVGIDGSGNVLVAWDLVDQNSAVEQVQARLRASDGTLGSVDNVSSTGSGLGDHYGLAQRLAMSAGGNAFIVWQIEQSGCSCLGIQARERRADGTYTAVQSLSNEVAEMRPVVAVDRGKDALAAWIGSPNNVTKASSSPK